MKRPGRRAGRVTMTAMVLVAVLGMTLAGCSSGDESAGDADGAAEPMVSEPEAAEGGSSSGGADSAAGDDQGRRSGEALDGETGLSVGAPRTAIQTRKVISTGRVTLQAENLLVVRDEIDRLLGRFGGYVADETTYNDRRGRTTSSTLVLRVPADRFDRMMDAFEDFSTVTDVGREAQDVTTEVIDVDARIRTQEVSLRRLRGFLGQATDVETMIRLESEIAQREAELSSLRAQQRYLDDQTSLATITVTLDRLVPPKEPEEDDPLDDAGFLTGLRNGWNALLDILVVTATVVGAVVPFAVLVAVLGLPLALWLRATRRRTPRSPAVSPGLPEG